MRLLSVDRVNNRRTPYRLFRVVILEQRVRIERICFKASMAFARRLPDSETENREIILHQAQQQIARDPHIWTNLGALESSLAAVRELGCPGWIVGLVRGWGMFRLRLQQRSRKRIG
jgi:hypothetical protein